MKRFQARRGNGRFQRNTLENTMGLRAGVCPHCRSFNPSPTAEAAREFCAHCGCMIATCAHGRRTAPFVDPFNRRGDEECGKPAVAVSVVHRWPVCAEHGASEAA